MVPSKFSVHLSGSDFVSNEGDGTIHLQADADIDSPGVEITYHNSYQTEGDGHAIWTPFSKDGRLDNNDKSWVSDKEKLGGAIAVRFTLKPGEKKVIPMAIAWDFPVVQFGLGRNRRRG